MSEIYDFIYADHEKVASILSQMEENSAPKETSIRAQRGRDTKRGASAKLSGIGVDISSGKGLQYEVRQVYDPLWTNSRQLIEIIPLSSGIDSISLGNLVRLQGSLVAFDQSLISKMLGTDAMRDMIARGMNTESSVKNKSRTNSDNRREADIIQKYIIDLGLSINFVLSSLHTGFWFNINRDYLYLHEIDIPLKFPVIISGEWNVIGIVDALPSDQFELESLDVAGADPHMPSMLAHFGQLIGITSVMFGRRSDSYGIKPLVIFRKINIPSLHVDAPTLLAS